MRRRSKEGIMLKKLAALLRTWADKLDPPAAVEPPAGGGPGDGTPVP